MQSERDHSDKLVQFNIFTQTLVVVILWDASRHSGRFSKAKIGGNIQCSDLGCHPQQLGAMHPQTSCSNHPNTHVSYSYAPPDFSSGHERQIPLSYLQQPWHMGHCYHVHAPLLPPSYITLTQLC